MTAVLQAHGLTVGYGSLAVARDLDITVEAGQVVLVLGPNGAGKTTTLLSLAGALAPLRGEVSLADGPVTSRLHRRTRKGLALVPDERGVITQLTVEENLRLGLGDRNRAYEIFPELRDHRRRRAGLLSGGQQKMLALALALSRNPSVLLADELSLGLAPRLVERLLHVVRDMADAQRLGVLLVEQHAHWALEIADYVILLVQGRIEISGPVADERPRLEKILAGGYLALTDPPEQSEAGKG